MEQHLTYLKLSFIAQHYAELAKHAAQKAWPHVDYLTKLAEGKADWRRDHATKSRISAGVLSRHQNPGAVPLGLANED